MHRLATIGILTASSACTGATEADAETPENRLATPFEVELLGGVLQEVRAGVRPFDEQGIGVCRGTHHCEEYLGAVVEEPLPAGEYGLFAALRVPPIGEPGTWKVAVTVTCTGSSGEASAPYTREHEVVAPPGRTERPFRLLLQRITSPGADGPRECTWSVTTPHPDHPSSFEGSWKAP